MVPSVKDVYNEIGLQFSASRAYIWPDIKPFLDRVKPNETVLDLGCGNGRILDGLPKNINYTGIDFSPTLLSKAKEKHSNSIFIESDITDPNTWQNLPKYDHIFCVAVIHHLPDKIQHLDLLKRIKKHLKPNGKFLVTAWNLWQPKYLKYHLDPATKLKNLRHVYIPFQNNLRFHFAFTKPYLNGLLSDLDLKADITLSPRNYLVNNFYKDTSN